MIVRGAPRPLKVTWVATKAVPFVSNGEKGLAEVAGKIPSALKKLGVDVCLVLPMFRQTAEAVKRDDHRLQDLFPLKLEIGDMPFEPMVRKLDAPYTHSYPVYFIEHAQLFDRPEMYGRYEDNLTRFSVLGLATIHLSHKMGEAPDIFDVHEHQGAHTAVYLNHFRKHPKNALEREFGEFFKYTRIALGIHAPNFKGEINPRILSALGLGWPNMLTAGINNTDLSYARSYEFISQISDGETDIARLLRDELAANRLVGLVKSDKDWDPSKTLIPEHAYEAAKRILGIYRHLAERPFGDSLMEEAKQTVPHLHWKILTPRELFAKLNPEAGRLYNDLPEEDKNLIDSEVYAGRMDRFKRVKNKRDLESILNLLKIKPVCDFEGRMKEEGLNEFLLGPNENEPWFYPGDINRLLSVEIDLSRSENEKIVKAFGTKGKTALYPALEKLGIIDHIIKVFLSLKRIAYAQEIPVSKLAGVLSQRGDRDEPHDEAAGIGSEIHEFRLFSGIYNVLSKDPIFPAVILGTLLHDIGKFLETERHPEKGVDILKEISALEIMTSESHLELVNNIVRFHSTFGDSVVTGEANPANIESTYKAYKDESSRNLLLDALLILGVADMDAVGGERGLLTPHKIKNLLRTHKAVITASDLTGLKKNMAEIGLSPESWGNRLWDHWIMRRIDSKSERARSKKEARKELVNYARRQTAMMRRGDLKARLGLMHNIWGMEDVMNLIDNPRLRARLIIRIVELSKDMFRLKFRISRSILENQDKLLNILNDTAYTVEDTKQAFKVEINEQRAEVVISL
jgi:hypothetical protein